MPASVIKTLDDIINKNDRYDVNKITYYTMIEDAQLIIRDSDLFDTYARFIVNYVRTYTVSDYQRAYYRCKPHLLSYDVYGTPELVWLVIRLNDMECPSKFRLKRTVNLIPADILPQVFDAVVTRSTDKLQENWNTYLPLITFDPEGETTI